MDIKEYKQRHATYHQRKKEGGKGRKGGREPSVD